MLLAVMCPTGMVLRVREEASRRGISQSAYVRAVLEGRAARDHRAYECIAAAVRDLRDVLIAATYQLRGRAQIPEDTIRLMRVLCGRVEKAAENLRRDESAQKNAPVPERKENK